MYTQEQVCYATLLAILTNVWFRSYGLHFAILMTFLYTFFMDTFPVIIL